MARSDLLIQLVKAGVAGDNDRVRTAAEAIAADERAKKHLGVAERISRALDSEQVNRGSSAGSFRRGNTKDSSGGIHHREPRRPISSLYIDRGVRETCNELIEEHQRADLLRAHGLEPRHRVLLSGPPGNGKTSLAESIAYELGLPFFTVRYEAVITSYLGETAQRLRRLFDFVRTQPCVLFFDEFDAIGKERGDVHETGEIKRLVTSLLLQLDDLPSYCVVIGATNHPELLDRAAWRRFEVRMKIGAPSSDQLQLLIGDQLKRFRGDVPGYTAKRLCSAVDLKSYSEAENFFLDVNRRWVLCQQKVSLRSVIDDRVRAWNSRVIGVQGEIDNGRSSSSSVGESKGRASRTRAKSKASAARNTE